MKTVFFAFCLMMSGWSQAALIQLQPDSTDYQIGDTIQLNLSISNLTETVGSFWTEIFYQPSAFSLQSWQFGSGLDDGFGSLQFDAHDAAMGRISLDEFAFFAADESILAQQQGNGFVLASLSFVALQAGDFLLSFNPIWFGVENFAGDIIDASFTNLNLNVASAQVPAPATAMLLLLGLGFLLRRR